MLKKNVTKKIFLKNLLLNELIVDLLFFSSDFEAKLQLKNKEGKLNKIDPIKI
tara:strand:+ start:155 stop:313 length:159 start_codon:yes stop_codon:yes gene_type:complete